MNATAPGPDLRVPRGPEAETWRALAAKLIWWQAPELSLQHLGRLIAQVMVLGTWQDVQTVRRTFGDEAFQAVLRDAPPGVFDARSWAYWHHVFHWLPVPPLPQRSF